ncbi:MAG TPA: dienelactone hydrolase family protein [Candidatus Paceibacterota bacterium]
MEKEIHIKTDGVVLEGILSVPEGASGIVLFVHGSGSSRFSPRNTFVAKELQKAGIATLLIDLLTEKEDKIYETRFDIGLLTERLGRVFRWLGNEPGTKDLAVGLFGASTGAAAALMLAAMFGKGVAAMVSRGGRPDLAMKELGKVEAPTLLIVGGEDHGVIELNERAFAALRCEKKLEIVPGATHLFEESGALERVADLAAEWFARFFTTSPDAYIGESVGSTGAEEIAIPSKFLDRAEKPAQPPGKTRGAAKEGYRPLHRK